MSTTRERARAAQVQAGKALDDAVAAEKRARRDWRSTPAYSEQREHAHDLLVRARQATKDAEQAHADAKRHVHDTKPVPLRERAYAEAVKLIGIMESGGNNVGAEVERIIREGGGVRGQAWCGWFCAAVYKRAGSKAVTWQWGAVRLFLPLPGLARTSSPQRGDLVRFTFDHVGMFVRDLGDGSIETIEGNTGASGAVSDSKTGGDGVYRKHRSKALVRDYIHISK